MFHEPTCYNRWAYGRTPRAEPSIVSAGEPVDGRFELILAVLGIAPNASILAYSCHCVKAPRLVAMLRLFGEKVRLLRRQSGMTQTELAHQVGLASHGHITNLETGRDTVSLDIVVRLARTLGVTIDYLLRDSIPADAPSLFATYSTDAASSKLSGTKLRALRQQRDWSQTDVARHLGLARRGYISNLEAGRKMPSLDLAVKIADLFGVTTDYLLRDEIPVAVTDGRQIALNSSPATHSGATDASDNADG
jgi:transcriptional regulator with XRE-family HTH domain